MKPRVYLDTSVFSALYDDRVADRRGETEEFWVTRNQFDVATSELAREELEQTPDPTRRIKLLGLLDGVTVHAISPEMRTLAASYVEAGTFTALTYNDALHVAAAVLTRQDLLLSWNFKHLVNRRQRAQINQSNISMGLPTIEIVAPPEAKKSSNVHYFDYEKIAREAQIPPEKLEELRHIVRQDFPWDNMMYELHLLRACMAIRDDVLTLDEALRPEPASRT